MESSSVLEEYANEQLAKIENFLQNERTPIYIDLVFEPSTVREHHRVELRVKSPNYDLISSYEHQGDGFYDTVDRVIDIMYRELHEKKQLLKRDKVKTVGRHDDFKKQR
jgi:ribosome-associated translation inhibitor RaiA